MAFIPRTLGVRMGTQYMVGPKVPWAPHPDTVREELSRLRARHTVGAEEEKLHANTGIQTLTHTCIQKPQVFMHILGSDFLPGSCNVSRIHPIP